MQGVKQQVHLGGRLHGGEREGVEPQPLADQLVEHGLGFGHLAVVPLDGQIGAGLGEDPLDLEGAQVQRDLAALPPVLQRGGRPLGQAR